MGDSTEHQFIEVNETESSKAKQEALEKLPKLKKTLLYYGQTRSLYINMNGAQTVLSKNEIIEHFRNSPVLFHGTGGKKRLREIAHQGLTTVNFRQRAENIFPPQKPPIDKKGEEQIEEEPYDEERMWEELLAQEYQMDMADRSMGNEYNYKYISLTFIPWWNTRGVDKDKLNTEAGHFTNPEGQLELGNVSIVLDESESKKIIDKNCEELGKEQPDSEFSQIVNDRTVAFAEALEPLRISPKHIAAIFLMEGRTNEISNEVEKGLFRQAVDKLGTQFKVPIFNYYGDLIWPKELTNQEVLDLVAEESDR